MVVLESISHSLQKYSVQFETPNFDQAFEGVASREKTNLLPTMNCLTALEDTPPLCIPMSEVEVANCERVSFGLKEFDLALVYKDLSKPVLRIDAIPIKLLSKVRQWLDEANILTYETGHNMLWKDLLKTIQANPKLFYENGGWSFLAGDQVEDEVADDESSESESSDSDAAEGSAAPATTSSSKAKPKKKAPARPRDDDSASDFEPESDGSDSEDYDSDEEVGDLAEEDSDDEEAEDLDSEDESGLDWDEMERQSKQLDEEASQNRKRKGADDWSDTEKQNKVKRTKVEGKPKK